MASATQHEEILAAFPYPPYEIQQQLMINVYEALQNKQIGLFESPTGAIPRSTFAEQVLLLLQCLLLLTPCCTPTGTGKTLSMICSTLKWLEDERQAQAAAAAAAEVAAKAAGGVRLTQARCMMFARTLTDQCQHMISEQSCNIVSGVVPVLYADEETALPDWMQSFGATSDAAQPEQQPAQKAKQQVSQSCED
jgi:hypothetical protein